MPSAFSSSHSSASSSSIILYQWIEPCTNHKKEGTHRCLISNCDQSPINRAIQVITRIFWRRRKPIFVGHMSVLDPCIDWCVNTDLEQRRRRRQTVFVYEDQVFSAADGSQAAQFQIRLRRSELVVFRRRCQSVRHRVTTRWDLLIHFNAFTVQIIIWTVTEDPENVPSREEGKYKLAW